MVFYIQKVINGSVHWFDVRYISDDYLVHTFRNKADALACKLAKEHQATHYREMVRDN